MKQQHRWGLAAVFAALSVWLSSCGGGATGDATPPAADAAAVTLQAETQTLSVQGYEKDDRDDEDNDDDHHANKLGLPKKLGLKTVLQPETLVLGKSVLRSISRVQITNQNDCAPGMLNRVPCEFTIVMKAIPRQVKVGSVLVGRDSAATPNGLLVKVKSLSGTTIQATEATLGDAVAQGEFRGEQVLTRGNVRGAQLLPGLSLVQPSGVQGQALTAQALSLQVNHVQVAPGVYFDGNVNLNLDCGAYGGLTYTLFIPTGVKFNASCALDQNLALQVSSSVNVSVNKEYLLGQLNFNPIIFFIGPVPVVLVPTVSLYLNINGQVSAQVSYGFDEGFQARAGIAYDDGFKLIKDLSAHATQHPVTVQGFVKAKAALNIKASLLLYGLAGASFNTGPYLQLEGGPGHNPFWCLTAGLEGGLSLDLDLKIKHLTYGPVTLYNFTEPLVCDSNHAPTLSIEANTPLDANHTIYLLDQATISLTGHANDLEQGNNLTVVWRSNVDGNLGSSHSDISTQLYLHTPGPQTITGTTTDSAGASASATFTVNVVVPYPSVTLSAADSQGHPLPGATIDIHQGDFITLSAAVAYPVFPTSGLPCTSLTWASTGPAPSGGGCQVGLQFPAQGTYTMTATANDGYGHTGNASLTVNVGPPPVTAVPNFSAISATKVGSVTPTPTALNDGDYAYVGDSVTFNVDYLNASDTNIPVRYEWTLSSPDGGTQTLTTAASETTHSARSWAVQYYGTVENVTVEVKIYNANTNELVATRTFHLLAFYVIG